MTISNSRPLNGCHFETDLVEAPVATAGSSTIPERVDLRSYCSPVEDQGQTNSCTANAIVGALEYHQRRIDGQHIDLSRLFAYYNARKMASTQHLDCGSQIHHVMASVMAFGVCEERVWPFRISNRSVEPPPEAYANATQFQAAQYARTPLGPAAMAAVADEIPVVFGTFLPSNFYSIAETTGAMPEPGPQVIDAGSGHAMVLVGYDQPGQYWIVRNSWGPRFGDNGYCKIPFNTLAAYSVPQHFWIVGAIEQANRLSLNQPGSQAQTITVPSHLKIDLDKLRTETRNKLEGDLARNREGFRSRLRS